MPARLSLYPPQRASRFLVVKDGETLVIGRDADCGLVIEDKKVSKRHAELRWTGAGWTLSDLGSKNGTSVNSVTASGAALANGDWLSFGGIMGRFERITEEESHSLESERLARLQTSIDMRRRLGDELEPLDLLLRFLESAMEIARADRGFVLVVGEDGKLRTEVSAGISPERMSSERFAGSRGAIERALETGEAVVAGNTRADAFLGVRESVVTMGIGALACVPLKHDARILGLLYIDSARPGAEFTAIDLEILESLADHTSVLVAGLKVDRRIRKLLARPEVGGLDSVGTLTQAFAAMVRKTQDKTAEMTRGLGPALGAVRELRSGELFAGRYQILVPVGRGGMGAVYRAIDRELDEEVALKVFERSSKEADQRLRQEIKLARLITHPNVVRTHDYGEAGAERFLTMEYVPGRTLKELLAERRGAMEISTGLQVAKHVCRGLSAVHKAGIVHGDLKPSNVIVSDSGLAKIMDFGLARAARQPNATGEITGSPHYMSPEQTKGGDLDERSDVYAAGVVIFQLLTGRVPFDSENLLEVLRMHQEDPPPDPRFLRPGLPEPLVDVVLSCLAKSRVERPATAADLDRLLMRVRV